MKLPPLNKSNSALHKEKFAQLTESHQRKWGKLDAHGMIVHICTSIKMSLGEIPVEDKSNFFTRTWIFRKLIFEVLPIPKGKIKVPDMFTPKPTNTFEEDKQTLFELLDHFAEELEKDPKRMIMSPMLGKTPLSFWSIVHGTHNTHHLKQFGIE